MTPFEAAMAALEMAHGMVIDRERRAAAAYMDRGLTPSDRELTNLLAEIDEMERRFHDVRRQLRAMAV